MVRRTAVIIIRITAPTIRLTKVNVDKWTTNLSLKSGLPPASVKCILMDNTNNKLAIKTPLGI